MIINKIKHNNRDNNLIIINNKINKIVTIKKVNNNSMEETIMDKANMYLKSIF